VLDPKRPIREADIDERIGGCLLYPKSGHVRRRNRCLPSAGSGHSEHRFHERLEQHTERLVKNVSLIPISLQ